jgi:hypothetical protein
MKIDPRTVKNLEETFDFLAQRQEFTGPELQKNKSMRGSIVYDLLRIFRNKHFIESAGEKPSSGATGKTEIYRLTIAGKILAAFATDNMTLLVSALKDVLKDEANPIKQFAITAFIKNYENPVMQSVLESSIKRAISISVKEYNIDQLMTELILNTFTLSPNRTQDQTSWFKKNADLMEESPHRGFLFQYFKMQIEALQLMTLKGDKLKKYAETLTNQPEFLHLPCISQDCTKVITTKTFVGIDTLGFCEECKTKENKKNGEIEPLH